MFFEELFKDNEIIGSDREREGAVECGRRLLIFVMCDRDVIDLCLFVSFIIYWVGGF